MTQASCKFDSLSEGNMVIKDSIDLTLALVAMKLVWPLGPSKAFLFGFNFRLKNIAIASLGHVNGVLISFQWNKQEATTVTDK